MKDSKKEEKGGVAMKRGIVFLQVQFDNERMRQQTHFDVPALSSLFDKVVEEIKRPPLTIQPWNSLYLLELVNEGMKDDWAEKFGRSVFTGIETDRNALEDEKVIIPEGVKYRRYGWYFWR